MTDINNDLNDDLNEISYQAMVREGLITENADGKIIDYKELTKQEEVIVEKHLEKKHPKEKKTSPEPEERQ